MFTYKYKDELGNEVTIRITRDVHKVVADEPKFERRLKDEYSRHITDMPDGEYEALPSPEVLEESVFLRHHLRDIFNLAHDSCTELQWRRFLLHVVDGKSAAEIACLQGCTVGSVRRSLRQVMDKIMNNL